MRAALARIAEDDESTAGTVHLALGDIGKEESIRNGADPFVPYQDGPSFVARYYQAADVYVARREGRYVSKFRD